MSYSFSRVAWRGLPDCGRAARRTGGPRAEKVQPGGGHATPGVTACIHRVEELGSDFYRAGGATVACSTRQRDEAGQNCIAAPQGRRKSQNSHQDIVHAIALYATHREELPP